MPLVCVPTFASASSPCPTLFPISARTMGDAPTLAVPFRTSDSAWHGGVAPCLGSLREQHFNRAGQWWWLSWWCRPRWFGEQDAAVHSIVLKHISDPRQFRIQISGSLPGCVQPSQESSQSHPPDRSALVLVDLTGKAGSGISVGVESKLHLWVGRYGHLSLSNADGKSRILCLLEIGCWASWGRSFLTQSGMPPADGFTGTRYPSSSTLTNPQNPYISHP